MTMNSDLLMEFPFYIQKAIDLGLLQADGTKITGCNSEVVERAMDVARVVDKLQPTSVQEREDTLAQEAIVLSRVLSSPSGQARELWSELRTGFGMGHGQLIPTTLWSDECLRAVAKEIDLTFIGERSNQFINRESLIASYTNLSNSSRKVPIIDFTQTVSELSELDTIDRYGEVTSEWETALDILKQVRVRALYLETLHEAKQNIKADTNLEEALEYLQRRAMEGVGMMRGSIGSQGQAVGLIDAIIGNPGAQRQNWVDRVTSMTKVDPPASTGIDAFDIDIDGGVARIRSHRSCGGRLLTIAARTSVGKTAIGCQIAASLCAQGMTVGFVSAELEFSSIEARLMASLSRKLLAGSGYHWRATDSRLGYVTVGELESPSSTDKDELGTLLGTLAFELQEAGGKLLVEAPWGADVDSAVNSMRQMKAKNPELRAVVLDHFHVLSRHKNAPKDNPSMLEERAYKLMTAAKELDIDLFVLAQMNQVGIKNAQQDSKGNGPQKPPELDQIRGTDALSHVSHAVWLIRRHENPGATPSERKLEVWHSKVRGRQAFWEGIPPNEQITTVQGFVSMSLIQLDYQTCSLRNDDTMQNYDVVRSSRLKR
jgi:hypothetical protein